MDTSASFLDALQSASNEDAWRTLDEAYGPLIRGWLQRQGADWADTDDVVQEVMLVVARRFGDFHRQRTGAFRSWLKTIAVNCLRDHWRRQKRTPKAPGGSDFGEMLAQLEDPHSGISKQWDREHDRHVTEYLLRQIQPQFTPQTWSAFQSFALEGKSADQTAQELQITPNAVFIAKSRVMASLRRAGRGLID